jgi:Cys-tRNA(Pro)/Cys-tRNA(Cys) deacylase
MDGYMSPVNNITRFLDSRKIPYTAFETPVEKLGAQDVARLLDVEPASVFKTIVVTREKRSSPADKPGSSSRGRKPLLVLVPGPSSVDLKLLASAVGEKKVHLPTEREAEALTGLQAGGISPLALINKGFQVVIDSSARNFPQIHVSGGQRGINIRLSPDDLASLTNARFAPVCTNRD